jgi:cysteinyl-tRNA synthetase
MKLYDTMSRSLKELKPLDGETVKVYTCGLTVYSQPHIGNWVPYIYWDLLVRTLKANGYNVERVQNYTDVGHLVSDDDDGEDKMEKGARTEGITAWDVAEKYIAIAENEAYDMLGLLRPDTLVRATACIDEQIAFVQGLESKGFTYVIDGEGVYFDTSKLNDYGKLARLDIDGLREGARVEINGKKNPTDFALWKFSPKDKKRDMEWWAPWSNIEISSELHPIGYARALDANAVHGDSEQRNESYEAYDEVSSTDGDKAMRHEAGGVYGSAEQSDQLVQGSWGFPGWHLECSVIARQALGDQIDIHTGGVDHIPVHHTNEIAQTESLTGKQFSQIWMHNNHLKVDGGKMSKSLGNIYTLQDIIDHGHSLDAFKLMILSKHYRTEGNFTWEILEAAQNRIDNWNRIFAQKWQQSDERDEDLAKYISSRIPKIQEEISNDLNTAGAFAIIEDLLEHIDDPASSDAAEEIHNLQNIVESLLGIKLVKTKDISDEQKELLKARTLARENKDWAESDRIRDELKVQGIGINDGQNGQIWHRL